MATAILDKYIDKIYNEKVYKLEIENDEYERTYFSNNFYRIPNGELLDDSCYNDTIKIYKNYVSDASNDNLIFVFDCLKNFYFFSGGNDMVFRKKLEADSYHSTPIKEVIYPRLVKQIHNRFFDSDNFFHPDRSSHISYIESIIDEHLTISAFLHYMYANDFNPANDIVKKFISYNKIRNKLDYWDLTIGNYIKALINYKCDIMKDIFTAVSDFNLRENMHRMVDSLRYDKIFEVEDLYNQKLHVNYFLDHTIYDLIDGYDEKKLYYK